MDLQEFLDPVNRGELIQGGSELHLFMHGVAQEALRTIARLNTGYHTADEVRALLHRADRTACGRVGHRLPAVLLRIRQEPHLREAVFINMGCTFQDAGGITIGDGTLIGHGSTVTTLNHGVDPAQRADMLPSPVVIGRNVWLGASVTVVPGVTIGDGAIVGAGAVVTKDVAANTIVAGVPGQAHRHDRVRRRERVEAPQVHARSRESVALDRYTELPERDRHADACSGNIPGSHTLTKG